MSIINLLYEASYLTTQCAMLTHLHTQLYCCLFSRGNSLHIKHLLRQGIATFREVTGPSVDPRLVCPGPWMSCVVQDQNVKIVSEYKSTSEKMACNHSKCHHSCDPINVMNKKVCILGCMISLTQTQIHLNRFGSNLVWRQLLTQINPQETFYPEKLRGTMI